MKEGEKACPLELLGTDEDVTKVFRSFNRTRLCPKIKSPIKNSSDFVDNYFKKNWTPNKSCLVVVNTVKISIEVFRSIKKYFEENGIRNPIYYLSTNIVPAVRQLLIDDINDEIRIAKKHYGLKPVLVSTQCVEAGVDIDFDMAFRDLAPIDSIIQVAGRVNRENDRGYMGSVYIVDFAKCNKIYGPMTENTVRSAINHFTDKKPDIEENRYLDLINYYYNNIYKCNEDGFDYSINFFNSMKELDYDGSDWSVSNFQVIQNGFKTSSVYIECDEKATKAKEMFNKMIKEECTREDFEPFKRDFHQHIIAVPDYLDKLTELKTVNSTITDDILYVSPDILDYYYDSTTGFIRDKEEESWGTIL